MDYKNEKGVVFGAGFLGTKIADKLRYLITPRSKVDVLDTNSLRNFLDEEKPDIVINAVGKTGRPNIDWCEDHKEETVQGNILAPVNLAIECSKRDIYFVHLGSGCIYYGNNYGKGFNEKDEPNFYGPQFYAKTKILSEKILKEFPSLVLRLRMPVDDRPHERNLVDKLLKYDKLIDTQNSMTTVPPMIDAIKQLIEKRCTGVYNLVNPGTISSAEIMTMYKEIVDQTHNFEIFSLEKLDKITKGKRSNCILNTDKLKNQGIELPEIHLGVQQCLLKYRDYKK